MKKRLLLLIIAVLALLVYGCAQDFSVTEEMPENPQVLEDVPKIEESQPIEKEANNLTEVAPPEQGVIVDQPVIQKTEVQRPTCSREFSPQFNVGTYYNGPLFDAHFHMPPPYEEYEEQDGGWRHPVLGKDITLDQILCSFDKEKVRGAITFNFWEAENLEQSVQDTAEMKKRLPLGIHLFLIPSELLAEELDEIVTSHKGVYDGFGEITHYSPERSGQTPDDPASLEMYKVAAKHGLIVMFHPGKNQRSKIENALQKNPDTKFLLHGPEAEDYITDLINKYPNVYYSIDTMLIRLPNSHGPLMYTVSGKEEYKLKFTQNFDAMLNGAVNKWKNRIEQHPDRFMWGTDRAADWHHNEEISSLVEEFARAFTGRLDPAVQEKYAYKNAERILQER